MSLRSAGNRTGQVDARGNPTALRTADLAEPPRATFAYDALNRLTAFRDGAVGTAIESYTYDATGNRTGFTHAGGSQSYTYPTDSHRLTGVAGVPRTYDANGNTTAIGAGKEFVYSAANRLSEAKQGGVVTMHYAYNGKGERVRRHLGTDDVTTMYDETGRWLGDYDVTGTPIQQAIWLDDNPVGLLVGASGSNRLHYVQPDHLGTPRSVIDPIRNVAVWTWDLASEAFGNSPPNQDPDNDGTTFVFDMRFPGQRYDAASALNYNYFRDYEPSGGRYSQSDPIGLDGGINTFAYALGSPTLNYDPLGLRVEVRCRRVGDPVNQDLRSRVAGGLGGEHCFVAVSCKGKDGTLMPETTISYLGPVTIATNSRPQNNDTIYTDRGQYRSIGVSPSGSDNNCPSCEFEKCILSKAAALRGANFRISNYSIWGPNSNSFARRLVESCGGQVTGDGPPTGWDNAGSVGF